MRHFHVVFQITTHNHEVSLLSRRFVEKDMTTKFPTPKIISKWESSERGSYGYCHFMSYVELSEDEE